MYDVNIWVIGTAIYGGLFLVILLAWVPIKTLACNPRVPFPSLCGLSCFGFYAWGVMAILTALHVLDCALQTVMGVPLVVSWFIAQMSSGDIAFHIISRCQYPPQRLQLFPGGFLLVLVFYQVSFYALPYLPGVKTVVELSLLQWLTFMATGWGGQGVLLFCAYKFWVKNRP